MLCVRRRCRRSHNPSYTFSKAERFCDGSSTHRDRSISSALSRTRSVSCDSRNISVTTAHERTDCTHQTLTDSDGSIFDLTASRIRKKKFKDVQCSLPSGSLHDDYAKMQRCRIATREEVHRVWNLFERFDVDRSLLISRVGFISRLDHCDPLECTETYQRERFRMRQAERDLAAKNWRAEGNLESMPESMMPPRVPYPETCHRPHAELSVGELKLLRRAEMEQWFRCNSTPVSLTEFILMVWPNATMKQMRIIERWCMYARAINILNHSRFTASDEEMAEVFQSLDFHGNGMVRVRHLIAANIFTQDEVGRLTALNDLKFIGFTAFMNHCRNTIIDKYVALDMRCEMSRPASDWLKEAVRTQYRQSNFIMPKQSPYRLSGSVRRFRSTVWQSAAASVEEKIVKNKEMAEKKARLRWKKALKCINEQKKKMGEVHIAKNRKDCEPPSPIHMSLGWGDENVQGMSMSMETTALMIPSEENLDATRPACQPDEQFEVRDDPPVVDVSERKEVSLSIEVDDDDEEEVVQLGVPERQQCNEGFSAYLASPYRRSGSFTEDRKHNVVGGVVFNLK